MSLDNLSLLDTQKERQLNPGMSPTRRCQLDLVDMLRAKDRKVDQTDESFYHDYVLRHPERATYPAFLHTNYGRVRAWTRAPISATDAIFDYSGFGGFIQGGLLIISAGSGFATDRWGGVSNPLMPFLASAIAGILYLVVVFKLMAPFVERIQPRGAPLTYPEFLGLHWHVMSEVEREQARAQLISDQLRQQLGPEFAELQRQVESAERRASAAQGAAYHAASHSRRAS